METSWLPLGYQGTHAGDTEVTDKCTLGLQKLGSNGPCHVPANLNDYSALTCATSHLCIQNQSSPCSGQRAHSFLGSAGIGSLMCARHGEGDMRNKIRPTPFPPWNPGHLLLPTFHLDLSFLSLGLTSSQKLFQVRGSSQGLPSLSELRAPLILLQRSGHLAVSLAELELPGAQMLLLARGPEISGRAGPKHQQV